MPDATTLWLFRERLAKAKAIDRLANNPIMKGGEPKISGGPLHLVASRFILSQGGGTLPYLAPRIKLVVDSMPGTKELVAQGYPP